MAIRFTAGSKTFETYEPGTYDLKIVSAEQKTNKKGNPQLAIKCEFVGGRYDGKTIFGWYSLLENSMWKVGQLVEAAGCAHTVEAHDAKGNPIVSFEETDLVGCIFMADITVEEYNSQKNNRINNERPSDLAGDVEEEAQEAAPAPAPEPKPVATTQTMARRPRTLGKSA